jgi:hypothetical protein
MHTSEPNRPPPDGLGALDPDKLAKVCEYLTSSHDGERAAAAFKASTMLRDAGVTWTELVDWAVAYHSIKAQPQEAPKAQQDERPATRSAEWKGYRASALVAKLRAAHEEELSKWERKFVKSLSDWGDALRCSPAQWDVLLMMSRRFGLVEGGYA